MNHQSDNESKITNASVRKQILVIDDEVDLCTLMRNFYRRKNYEVFIAHDAEGAVQAINETTPDLHHWERVRKHADKTAPNAQFLLGGIDVENIRNL